MKETPRSRITVTSSSKEISADSGGGVRRRLDFARPRPFIQHTSGQIFKDDVIGLSSTSDICFLLSMLHRVSSVYIRDNLIVTASLILVEEQ
jgi:hypothetical protein